MKHWLIKRCVLHRSVATCAKRAVNLCVLRLLMQSWRRGPNAHPPRFAPARLAKTTCTLQCRNGLLKDDCSHKCYFYIYDLAWSTVSPWKVPCCFIYYWKLQAPVNSVLIGVTTTCLLLNTLHITCDFKCSFNFPLHMMQGHILHVPFLRIHHRYVTYCCCFYATNVAVTANVQEDVCHF